MMHLLYNVNKFVYSESGLGVAPWPPKRNFGGTPLSTEWLTHLPTKPRLPSVCVGPYTKKWWIPIDGRKTESVYRAYILLCIYIAATAGYC